MGDGAASSYLAAGINGRELRCGELSSPRAVAIAFRLPSIKVATPFGAWSHFHDLAHNVMAVRGEGAHLAWPAAFFYRFRPLCEFRSIVITDSV
jgi:hypothetical protein